MRKIILLFLFPFVSAYSQYFHKPNCDSIFSSFSGCYTFEKMPELIGGLDSLQSMLIYPKEALKNNIEGKVYVLTIIDSSGALLCSKVIKGLGYGCDTEAIRLVNNSKFNPAFSRGKPYATPFTIPIKFVIKKNGK